MPSPCPAFLTTAAARLPLITLYQQVCGARKRDGNLTPHKLPFAHAGFEASPDLKSAIQQLRPSVLVGVSTIGGAFDQEVLKLMADINVSALEQSWWCGVI